MEDNESKLLGRRQTLHLLGLGITATGLLGLAACKQDSGAPAGGQPSQSAPAAPPAPAAPAPAPVAALDCNTAIDAASKTTRKVMQYKNPAVPPEKKCSACSQYQEAKYGACGGCKLFTGPVEPNGGCQSFAAKT